MLEISCQSHTAGAAPWSAGVQRPPGERQGGGSPAARSLCPALAGPGDAAAERTELRQPRADGRPLWPSTFSLHWPFPGRRRKPCFLPPISVCSSRGNSHPGSPALNPQALPLLGKRPLASVITFGFPLLPGLPSPFLLASPLHYDWQFRNSPGGDWQH